MPFTQEKAVIPNWHHGEGDNLRLLEPGYPRRMLVTSLGNSIPTCIIFFLFNLLS